MAGSSAALAFIAGVLSIVSPCVLPILPIVIGTVAERNRFAPLALAVGLMVSFVGVGLFLATAGHELGFDADRLRVIASVLVVALGVWLLVPAVQTRLARAASPLSAWADQRLATLRTDGVVAPFFAGTLLGVVWSPCVGPTLGAASLLAAQGRDLGQVGLTMFAFGLGAALPLLLLGTVSRKTLQALRGGLVMAGQSLKVALGGALVVVGLMVITGLDKSLEANLVSISPEWLTDLTTRF
jgi:cytochrome c-type biogenesis protein